MRAAIKQCMFKGIHADGTKTTWSQRVSMTVSSRTPIREIMMSALGKTPSTSSQWTRLLPVNHGVQVWRRLPVQVLGDGRKLSEQMTANYIFLHTVTIGASRYVVHWAQCHNTKGQAPQSAATFFFATASQGGSRSRCQLQSTAAGDASRTGREAAGLRSLLPASVCQEFVQGWWRASSTKLRLEGELQESGSERTLRRNGDEATPGENPGGPPGQSRGQQQRHLLHAHGQGGEQRWQLPQPSVRQLRSENDEATASASGDLGVRLPSLADGPTRVVVSSVMWAAISGHRADERGVHGKLRAVP